MAHLNPQAQQLIIKVYEYFQKKKELGRTLLPIQSAQERCAAAVGICSRSLRSIVQRENTGHITVEKRKRTSSKTVDVDQNTKHPVREVIYQMYEDKQHITLRIFSRVLKEKEILDISYSQLRILLKNLGFSFKMSDNRRALCEKEDVVRKRVQFLRKYMTNYNRFITQTMCIFGRNVDKQSRWS